MTYLRANKTADKIRKTGKEIKRNFMEWKAERQRFENTKIGLFAIPEVKNKENGQRLYVQKQ